MNTRMLRQGDILLIPADVPEKSQPASAERENGRTILARGEKTGHVHSVDTEKADLANALFKNHLGGGFAVSEEVVLLVSQPTQLTHDEHAPLELEKGAYEVRRQREYVPSRPPRRVID